VPENASSFVIRRAEAADKDQVLAFCQHTFDWGDYLHLVWDDWFADETGPLLVATLDEEPVGVAKVSLVTPTEAWLQGLRIHPAYRRRGLAWQFQSHCLNVARELGASVARLATSSKNAPVHKMTERVGMRRVVEVEVLQAASGPPGQGSVPSVALTLEDWPQVFKFVFDGAALAAMGGLYKTDWMWHALTHDKLRAHLARGQVLAARDEDGEIGAVAIVSEVDPDDHVLPVGYADGTGPHVARMALGLREYAAALQADKAEVALPASSPLLQAFVQAGYKPEDEGGTAFYIYELDLKGAAL
jgi:GNAT superfamily N-acetyltransferase